LAKPNYAFAKRQKELAKKQKKEDKLRRKAEQKTDGEAEPGLDGEDAGPDGEAVDSPAPGEAAGQETPDNPSRG
jgi:hypothetical protein